jgi:hypothetical protein
MVPSNALQFAGDLVLWLWGFWALFVFTMGCYRAKISGRLKGLNLVFAFPIVVLAAAVDVVSNLLIAPIVFLDAPKELLVTSRLKRYMAGPDCWRKSIADYVCESVLDIFDPTGDHC